MRAQLKWEHMEMQHKATILRYLILVGIVFGLFINSTFAEELKTAKSEDVYVVPDEHDKENFDDIYAVENESILEDGRLFLQVNLASYHPNEDKDDDFNEFNPGLGLEYHFENFYIAGGFFENSIDKFSTYWGVGHERTFFVDWFGLGILGGVVTGYDSGFSPRLAAVPSAFFKKGRTTLKAYYVPAVGDVDADAIGFALRIDLGGVL